MFSQDRNTQLQQGKYRRFRHFIYLDRFNPKHLDTTLVFDLRTLFGLLLQVFGICDEKAKQNKHVQRLKLLAKITNKPINSDKNP